jgi:lipopolysaccharide/colanic/teichoic acid biosynthesis glycosyltransferase
VPRGQRSDDVWPDCVRVLDWYGRLARDEGHAVVALLPEGLADRTPDVLGDATGVTPIWYGDDGLTSSSSLAHSRSVWLVNGSQLPLVDWRAAVAAARKHAADVTVFGSTEATTSERYQESVSVGDRGEVLRFRRHYYDSPAFTDPWSGEAAFMSVSAENVAAVLNHVITRGWGLDSVGLLTRRFSVRWASDPCVLAEFDLAATLGSGEPARHDDRGAKIPRVLATFAYDGTDLSSESQPAGAVTRTADSTADAGTPPGAVPTLQLDVVSAPGVGSRNGLAPAPVRPMHRVAPSSAYTFAKRAVDVLAAIAGMTLLSPLLLTVAFLVKCTSRGPVLFGHKRQGLGGKEFLCWKFRSMCNGADAMQAKLRAQNEVDGPQFKIDNDPRLTKVGAWLRRTNIDELPQLINVLLGQMSLVGPRPSPDGENQLCPAWRRTRLSVKPGITGLWQVLRVRDDEQQSDFQEWIYYDVEYARHRSLWLDFQLLVYTPISIVAPSRLTSLAKRLQRRGICVHSARLRSPS